MKMKYFLSCQLLAFFTILEISNALSCHDCSSKKDDTIETCDPLPKHLIQTDPDICSTIKLELTLALEFEKKPVTLYIRKGEKRKSAGGISGTPGENCHTFSFDDMIIYSNLVNELTKEEAKNGNVTILHGEKCKCKSERCNRESLVKQHQAAEAAAHTSEGTKTASFILLTLILSASVSVFQLPRLFY